MSQYLKYILRRCGAPAPAKVIVAACPNDWAKRQIMDEFRAAFHGVEVTESSGAAHADCDLMVLPYLDELHTEMPGWRGLSQGISPEDSSWVMLYGLRQRKIEVMPARELARFLNDCRRVSWSLRILWRLSLMRLVSLLLERKASP